MPTVGFQFGFAGPPRSDSAAKAGQRSAVSGEAWEPVSVLGELYLQFSFDGTCPGGEDVQNEHGTVNDTAIQNFFQLPYLRALQFVVCNNEVDLVRFAEIVYFPCFSLADVCGDIPLFGFLNDGRFGFDSGGIGQAFQLSDGCFTVLRSEIHGNENGGFLLFFFCHGISPFQADKIFYHGGRKNSMGTVEIHKKICYTV